MTSWVVAAFILAFTVLGWPRGSSAGGLDIVVDTTDGGANNHDSFCSLREAITAANTDTDVGACVADSSSDLIEFSLGPDVPSISVLTPLPNIIDGVTIDGNTGDSERVELNGGGINANGLTIQASNVVIRNLVINNFGRRGVQIVSGNNNVLSGNFIGTDAFGAGAVSNTQGGIEVLSSGNTIGGANGTSPGGSCTGDCNLISGNGGPGIELKSGAANTQVLGNFIGTDVTGTGAVSNWGGILSSAVFVRIGGTFPEERNVISGNIGPGVYDGAAGTIFGNFIGTNSAGTGAVANSGAGVHAVGAGPEIGNAGGGAGNVISGNTGSGVYLEAGAIGSVVRHNFIGTDVSGNSPIGNAVGISSNASGAVIGGTLPGAGNVISGNSQNNVIIIAQATVQGNFIGTNTAGTVALAPGGGYGVLVSTAGGTIVGGTAPGARNVISGNGSGVGITSDNVLVQGNYIGTNANGDSGVPNGYTGVFLGGTGNTIGGSAAGAGNLISGHTGSGIMVIGGPGNVIQGNFIGTKAGGVIPLGNARGIFVCCGAVNNTIGGTGPGEGNVIAFSGLDGVELDAGMGAAAIGIAIRGNSIHDSVQKGISFIVVGANNGITPPTITGQNPVTGTACPNCKIDVFSDAADEGRTYHGSVTANGSGNWSFGGTVTGPNLTATNTDAGNNTSEFSAPFAYTGPTATPSASPSPTPVGQTPTPTPTPTPVGQTPSPTPAGQTPTPSPAATPTAPPEGWHQGDANCSGDIEMGDVTTLLKKAAGLPMAAGCPSYQNDVNCDGAKDALDALGDLLYLADAGGLATPGGCTPIGEPIPV